MSCGCQSSHNDNEEVVDVVASDESLRGLKRVAIAIAFFTAGIWAVNAVKALH